MKTTMAIVAALFAALRSYSDVPQFINYQGRLLTGTNLVNGSVGLSLRLYDTSVRGALLYEDSNTVTVVDGLYSTLIGDNSVAGSLSNALTNAAVFVEVAVNGTALVPRERLASVAYALHTAESGLATNAWRLSGNAGTAAGANFIGTTDDEALELRVNGLRAIRLEPTANGPGISNIVNVVGGAPVNFTAAGVYGATISGGGAADFGEGSPQPNGILADFATIGGGLGNRIDTGAAFSVIGGGLGNSIRTNSDSSVIGGGTQNFILRGSGGSVICGGAGNSIRTNAPSSTVCGGLGNEALAQYAFVGGGYFNQAAGFCSHAAGYGAVAGHSGSFVWADTSIGGDPGMGGGFFASTARDQFLVRAAGGVGINTNNPAKALHVNGDIQVGRPAGVWQSTNDDHIINFGDTNYVYIGEKGADDRMELRAAGFFFATGNLGIGTTPTTNKIQVAGGAYCAGSGTAWVNASDRNLKENFAALDARQVLEKVAALPVTMWNYKSDAPSVKHIGPMAQDFHAAFGVGDNDTSLSTIDPAGVALAAIQALKAENDGMRRENAELKAALESLAARIQSLEAR